jgi:queuine tRNA-ribosyltransferase
MFKIIKTSKISKARLGIIKTPHGNIQTPFFMPDATRGVIKNLSSDELRSLGLKCLVVNTLHLFLRPGADLIKKSRGLHKFINWPGAILSDSGGYQVYSLIHKAMKGSGIGGRLTDEGAIFKSPLNGAEIKLTPEQSIKIQFDLGVDFMICFDDCPPNDYDNFKLKTAVERTIIWARRCRREYDKQLKRRGFLSGQRPLLIAVIQGGDNPELRKYCSDELIKIGFDGLAFGARHIDEAGKFLTNTLAFTAKNIPDVKLRFGLGIGLPEDILKSVRMGWDMFDCVIPTREGRHGRLFLGKKNKGEKIVVKNKIYYETVNIGNAKFAKDFSPINEYSRLNELKNYSKAYLHYLFKINESLAGRLASLNNLEFYLNILSDIRLLIKDNRI